MSNISANPNLVNQIATTTDTSVVYSTGSAGSAMFSDMPVVTSNSHVIQTRADMALWDATSSAFVAIQNTTAGTTTAPKVGQ